MSDTNYHHACTCTTGIDLASDHNDPNCPIHGTQPETTLTVYPTEDTPTILGSSQDEATPTAQGHEADNSLLEAFAEYCHEHYMGCGKREGEELWEYCYSDEIINLVPQFLGKRAEVNDLAKSSPETTSADTQIRPVQHKKQELERGK